MSTFDDYIGTCSTDKIAGKIVACAKPLNQGSYFSGHFTQMRRNYRLYYNADPDGSSYPTWDSFKLDGENGEFLKVRANILRNLLQHILNMMFAKPPAVKAVASNNEGQSLDAARLFDNVINEMFATQRANRYIKKAGEYGLVFGTGFALVEWDSMLGEPYVPKDDLSMTYDGGIRIRAKSPFDVFWDQGKEEWDDVEWVVVRDYDNKYKLASQYPDKAQEILNVDSKDKMQSTAFMFDPNETDDIFVYKFYHKPISNNFLPNGRYVLVAGDGVVLRDEENPYDGLPVFRTVPMEGIGSCYGYTPANDLAPIQMFYNLLMTATATNVSANGVGNIAVMRGADLEENSLAGGANIIEYAQGFEPPQPLNLMSLSPLIPELMQFAERFMETSSGVSSVVRGNPDSSLKSGRALAIIQSQSVQFMSGFQMSIVNFVEDIGNFMLKLLQKFATTPRMAQIVGENEIEETFEWNNETMMRVARVRAEVVDPFTQTSTGKLEKADALLQSGLISSAQQYLTLAETGEDEPLYDAPMSKIKRIREENRMLKKGIEPLMLNTDPHEEEIPEHLTVLDHPQVRNNPQIAQVVLNHVMKHQMAMQGVQFDVMGNVLEMPPQMAMPPMLQQQMMMQQAAPEEQMAAEQMSPPGLGQITGPESPMSAQPLAQ